MVVAGWIAGIALLAALFDGWFEQQHNPNTSPGFTTLAGGAVEIVLQANRRGHYVSSGKINGQEAVFLLDTGATGVAVPEALARELGLARGQSIEMQTANGVSVGYLTVLDSVSIGPLVQRDVRGVIAPGFVSDEVLLGMSFLRHLNLQQSNGTLTVRQP
jgi:aspartyl protease family protein